MQCEHCGHEQPSGRFCDGCGRMLTRILIESQGAGETSHVSIPCRYCGHEQEKGRLCDGCGMQLPLVGETVDSTEEALARCRECGMYSKSIICRNCGSRIANFPSEEE